MKNVTEKELKFAYHIWQKNYQFNFVDAEMSPFLQKEILSYSDNQSGWLSNTRRALFLSAQSQAERLTISRSAYSQLEASEEIGTISLLNLKRAAEAMNCELVYAIRPKNKKLHAQKIWETLLPKALLHPWLQKCDQRKLGPALAGIALEIMNNPAFRRSKNWSNKANLLN